MNAAFNAKTILCGLGLYVVLALPVPPPADDSSGVFQALHYPVRVTQSEALAQDEGGPSRVYQHVSDLQSEIEILREAMGITDYPLEAEPEDDRAPIHVYSRVSEVHRKIAAAQRRLGMAPFAIPEMPIKEIGPPDVNRAVQMALAEVRRIKAQLVIEDEIAPAPFVGGKTPSMVYQHVGDASFMLDGLVGRPTDVSDVYANLMHLHGDMELVGAKLKVALELEPPIIEGRKRLKEVGQQVMRATFKLISLQTRLGMDSSSVPQIELVRIDPANLYESINIMDAEMVRIKAHLGIALPLDEERVRARNKRPRDVFVETLRLIKNLDILAQGADEYVAG